VSTITSFLGAHSLTTKPVYFLGASSGAGMMVRMQDALTRNASVPWRVSGLVSEVGTNAEVGKAKFPPTVWIVMERDAQSQVEARSHVASLVARAIPASYVVSPIRPITADFFSNQMAAITPLQSRQIVDALVAVGLIDSRGFFTRDPKARRDWIASFQKRVLPLKLELAFNRSALWQALLYAYARHEHVANYTTAALTWFEGGARESFTDLAARYEVSAPATIS
jgi:hypothetical protein